MIERKIDRQSRKRRKGERERTTESQIDRQRLIDDKQKARMMERKIDRQRLIDDKQREQ